MTKLEDFSSHVRVALALHGEVADEVVAALIDAVPAAERAAVLARIQRALATTQPEFRLEPAPELAPDDPARELVLEVDAFVHRLESGHYFGGLQWDEVRREQRAYGDETWAREMDAFLGRAATVYWGGNEPLAVHLYSRLLGAFRHEGKTGVFCGPEPAARMVVTDLSEARLRYLRALLRTAPRAKRAAQFFSDYLRLRDLADGEVHLHNVVTGDDDGPGLEEATEFARELAQWLGGLEREPAVLGRDIRRLLRESVLLSDGLDGLAALARQEGPAQPEAWHEWVGSLVRQGQLAAAVSVAREALAVLQDPGYRARMAERLVGLAAKLELPEVRLDAARVALRMGPTETRLAQFLAAAHAMETDQVLAGEAGEAVRPGAAYSDAIGGLVLLCAGRIEDALVRFQRADPAGWGRREHAGTTLLPVLLHCLGVPREPGSVLARLWTELDGPPQGYFDRRLLLDRMAVADELQLATPPLSQLLDERLARHGLLHTEGRARVSPARLLAIVETRLQAGARQLVRSHQRRSQVTAAGLIVALAEAYATLSGPEAAAVVIRDGRRLEKAGSPFIESLEAQRLASPLLTRVATRAAGRPPPTSA